MTEPGKAVFLSYASQDAEAAQRLCNALRAAGIEVWFDQSELRGGDLWDQKIRREIHDCALFIPVISANTASRHEGYFRLEWDLADQRTHMLARNRTFIVPVCLDATPDAGADVPESFQRVQWTRLPGGETPPEFVRRIEQLLSGGALPPSTTSARGPAGVAPGRPLRGAWLAVAVVIAAAAAFLFVEKPWVSRATPPAAFAPPPHSVAVLPFTNLSGDAAQEYFSDGISEELINALSQIDALHVTARTSSFSFKGQNADINTIARKLNVATILEGSIRRSGNTVRITAQLIDAIDGYHLWSQNFDRRLEDILALQTEIATAIAGQLRAKLDGNEAAKIEAGGTTNPQAHDAYLLGSRLLISANDEQHDRAALASIDKALAIDPRFSAAWARRSDALIDIVVDTTDAGIYRPTRDQAAKAAETAIALAPEYVGGYLALAAVRISEADFWGARPAIERALYLNPGNVRVQRAAAGYYSRIGHHSEGLAAARRAVALDPQNYAARVTLVQSLLLAGEFKQSLTVAQQAAALDPSGPLAEAVPLLHYYLHEPAQARDICASPKFSGREAARHYCLALAYNALGSSAKARSELQKYQDLAHDSDALEYAEIYAQWGDTEHALEWVEKAEQLHDPALQSLKVWPALDPIRNEPRFQAVVKRLNFPP